MTHIEMTKEEIAHMDKISVGHWYCPDCESRLMSGPSCGGATNMYCSNEKCGSGFYMDIFCGNLDRVYRITEKSPNAITTKT